MLSPVTVQNQNRRFSVMGIRKIINSHPLRRKLLRNFLLRVRSNNQLFRTEQKKQSILLMSLKTVIPKSFNPLKKVDFS
jgi:hypothetical protein